MSGFEPGEGWREVTDTSDMDKAVLVNYEDPKSRGWVRVPPVPPLPTVPYTVIRVEWANGNGRCTMICNGSVWEALLVPEERWSAEKLPALISSFQVLAEPRAVTAKAVLDRVLHLSDTGSYADEAVHQVRAEFGVTS